MKYLTLIILSDCSVLVVAGIHADSTLTCNTILNMITYLTHLVAVESLSRDTLHNIKKQFTNVSTWHHTPWILSNLIKHQWARTGLMKEDFIPA